MGTLFLRTITVVLKTRPEKFLENIAHITCRQLRGPLRASVRNQFRNRRTPYRISTFWLWPEDTDIPRMERADRFSPLQAKKQYTTSLLCAHGEGRNVRM